MATTTTHANRGDVEMRYTVCTGCDVHPDIKPATIHGSYDDIDVAEQAAKDACVDGVGKVYIWDSERPNTVLIYQDDDRGVGFRWATSE